MLSSKPKQDFLMISSNQYFLQTHNWRRFRWLSALGRLRKNNSILIWNNCVWNLRRTHPEGKELAVSRERIEINLKSRRRIEQITDLSSLTILSWDSRFSVQSHGLTTRQKNLTINRGASWKDNFLNNFIFGLLWWVFLRQFCANP